MVGFYRLNGVNGVFCGGYGKIKNTGENISHIKPVNAE